MLPLVALVIGFLLCAQPAWWMITHDRARADADRSRLLAELERITTRAADLEAMLNEIWARGTQTTPPPTVTSAPAEQPLPPEVERESAAIEDEEGRAELAEVARRALSTRPNTSVNELVGEVLGGQ